MDTNTTLDEMLAIDRLEFFIKTINVSRREFEQNVGVANGYIGNQLRRRGSISSGILNNILLEYPELNILWLLTGHPMIIPRTAKTNIIDPAKLKSARLKASA